MTSGVDAGALKAEALVLHKEREELQRRVREALNFLDGTPAGREGPLVDPEGFPRADCDLYAVRRARQEVACGRNDLRALDARLHDLLGDLHEATKAAAAAQMAAGGPAEGPAAALERRLAEARKVGRLPAAFRVVSVEPGGPAAEGGLRAADAILQFGGLNAETLREKDAAGSGGMRALAELTQESEGRLLSVWARGAGEAEPREVFVVPQRWSGVGLLGCALEPL